MGAFGTLLHSIADGIVGFWGMAFGALGAAITGIVANFQALLPTVWLPAVAFVVVLIVGFNLLRR